MNGFILIRNIINAMVKKWMHLAQIHVLCMSKFESGLYVCFGVEQVQSLEGKGRIMGC